jgi:CheY-like chemotaxis protein
MPSPETLSASGDRLIYLVDDEELLLELAELSLLDQGYELKKFQDPQAALESFTQEPRKPSLLLTDYAMTPMTGLELSTRCKSAHPKLKILIVSGTAGPDIAEKCGVKVDKFLSKPYKPDELANTVRSLLSSDAV